MEWIAVTMLFIYLAIGFPYAIYINKDWFKKAKNNKSEVDETMLCIGTTFIALVWPLFFIFRIIKKIL